MDEGTRIRLPRLVLGLIAAVAPGASGCSVRIAAAPGPAAPVKQPADTKGWVELVADDFDREEIGKLWRPTRGAWSIEGGALKGVLAADPTMPAGSGLADVLLRGRDLPPVVEVSYESWSPDEVGSEAKLLDADASQGLIAALYGVPHPALASKGAVVFLQAGANRYDVVATDRAFAFRPEVRHKVRIVRQPEGVTVFVDEKPVISAAVGAAPEARQPGLHLVGTFGREGSVVYFDHLKIRVPAPAEDAAK
jgi:hypothetical protein